MRKIQDILLYFLLFSLNFEVWDPFNTDGNFSISKLCGILYLLSLLPSYKVFLSYNRFAIKSVYKLFAFFILLTIMNIVYVNSFSDSIFFTTFIQWLFIMLIIVNHCINRTYVIDKLLLYFSFGAFLMSVLYRLGYGVEFAGGRVSIFGDNENSIGIRMSIAAFYFIYLFINNVLKQKFIIRFVQFIMIIPIVDLLINTGSRTAIISFIGMLFLYSIMVRSTIKHLRPILFLLILVLLSIVVFNAFNNEVLFDRLESSMNDGNLGGRDEIWKVLFPLISENPLLGVGQTGYAEFWIRNSGIIKVASPHNVFLEVLCYTGVLGFFLYFSFYLEILKKAFDLRKYKNDIYLFILFVPITGLMFSGQALGTKYIWCIYAIVIAKNIVLNRRV